MPTAEVGYDQTVKQVVDLNTRGIQIGEEVLWKSGDLDGAADIIGEHLRRGFSVTHLAMTHGEFDPVVFAVMRKVR